MPKTRWRLGVVLGLVLGACGGDDGGSQDPCATAPRYGSPTSLAAGTHPVALLAADLDGDGDLDLATSAAGAQVMVLLNRGDGTFAPAVAIANDGTTGLAAGDFNGDGRVDLASFLPSGGDNVWVYLNGGKADFAAGQHSQAGSELGNGVAGDFDLDGKADLAIANYGANGASPAKMSVLLDYKAGRFRPATDYPTGEFPLGVAAGDLDGDGYPELAVNTAKESGPVRVFRNLGDGTFGAGLDYAVPSPSFVVIRDLDGDGRDDLATADGNDQVSVLRNRGTGMLAAPDHFPAGPVPTGIDVGDMNGDGRSDLVVANAATSKIDELSGMPGNVSLLLNRGNGTFADAVACDLGHQPYRVVVGDFNRDGRLDLAATNAYQGTVSVALNSCGR